MKKKINAGQFTKKNAEEMGSRGGKATFRKVGVKGMSKWGKKGRKSQLKDIS